MSGPRTPIPLGVFTPDEGDASVGSSTWSRKNVFRKEAVTWKFIKLVF